jgi:ribosome-binding factor A
MSRRHQKGRADGDDFAAELGSEDGTDPKTFHDRRMTAREPRQGPGRKGLQLCGQVQNALIVALAGCREDVVRELTVLTVEPAPHTGRLLVTVAGPIPADVADQHLIAASPFLRREVARAIHRRKTPELVFRSLRTA